MDGDIFGQLVGELGQANQAEAERKRRRLNHTILQGHLLGAIQGMQERLDVLEKLQGLYGAVRRDLEVAPFEHNGRAISEQTDFVRVALAPVLAYRRAELVMAATVFLVGEAKEMETRLQGALEARQEAVEHFRDKGEDDDTIAERLRRGDAMDEYRQGLLHELREAIGNLGGELGDIAVTVETVYRDGSDITTHTEEIEH